MTAFLFNQIYKCMYNCYVDGVNIEGDVDGRLEKVCAELAKGNSKIGIILASYLNDTKFIEFLNQDSGYDSSKKLGENNLNVIKRNLYEYAKRNDTSIYFSILSDRKDNTLGFSSVNAKYVAIDTTADAIAKAYMFLINKYKGDIDKITFDELTRTAYDSMEKDFNVEIVSELVKELTENKEVAKNAYNRLLRNPEYNEQNEKALIDNLPEEERNAINELSDKEKDIFRSIAKFNNINNIIGIIKKSIKSNIDIDSLPLNDETKQFIKDYREAVKEYNSVYRTVGSNNAKWNSWVNEARQNGVSAEEIDKQREEYIKSSKETSQKLAEAQQKFIEAKQKINKVIQDNVANFRVLTRNFALNHGNFVVKNRVNLMERMGGNGLSANWFKEAFTSSKLFYLNKKYKNELESDKLVNEEYEDENDAINPDAENVDETTRNWEDSIWSSFDKGVSDKLKMYFNGIYKLATPGDINSDNYNYDRNNELGSKSTMGAAYIITQIVQYGNFNSLTEFIDSLYNVSQQISELYGFIEIVKRCKKDRVFANLLFTQLNNPKISKIISTLGDNGIIISQSNRASDAITAMTYYMINRIKGNTKVLYNAEDVKLLDEIISKNNKAINDNRELNEREKIIIENGLYEILNKYYPNITLVAIRSYIYNGINSPTNNINFITSDIKSLMSAMKDINASNDKAQAVYLTKLSSYNRAKRMVEESMGIYTKEKPAYEREDINANIDKLNSPIINIAKKLFSHLAINTELNSPNAEGKMGSDIINNSYITNILKQIAYGNKESATKGLELLRDEICKGEQYKYTPLFWGIKDDNGKTIVKGLFERTADGSITINPNAKTMIQVSLFDGVKDRLNGNSKLYKNMSKGDYFLTSLYTYFNPVGIGENIGIKSDDLKRGFSGYFMRTPSDAPKNFIVTTTKVNSSGLFGLNSNDVDSYINSKIESINNSIYEDENINSIIESLKKETITEKRKHNWEPTFIYDFINNPVKSIEKVHIRVKEVNKQSYGIISYYDETSKTTHYIVFKCNKQAGTTNNILENIKIVGIFDIDINKNVTNGLTKEFVDNNLRRVFENEAINNTNVEININQTVPIFYAFRQQFINELNTFVDQLNNLFVKNKDNKWVLRKDTTNLIDRAHYNGTIVKDGKLTGNFFSFRKLFDTVGFNTQEAVEQLFSLYGGDTTNLLQINGESGSLSLNNGLVQEIDGKLVLNLTQDVYNKANEIVKQWLIGYYKEINNRISEYNSLIDNTFSKEEVVDFLLNSANAEMNFDDLFEGDVKFYKNAQDFLKRAKEVQASGKSYAGFDLTDGFSERIHDVIVEGETQQITIGTGDNAVSIAEFANAYHPVEGRITTQTSANARNGFRAITITNTVRPSRYATKIEAELFNYFKTIMSEEQASKLASSYAKGYKENTKFNDAQSYITIEEFIRRRWADGTLNDYQDFLQQLYEVRTGKRKLEDLDISQINARIQVQKNFYFDKVFDPITNTYYPRQIKNAEFVLIPELLEGTQLKELYDIMIKHDIGQVNTAETSKAAKKNVLTFWDNNGDINSNFEQDVIANNESAIEDYYYRFLYKQQEVPEHMKDEENKAGTQLMKKIIDNINRNNPEMNKLAKQYFDNYCANIKDSFEKLVYAMGWKINDDGSISNLNNDDKLLDFREFYARARREAMRLGLDSNFLEYITPDDNGNPIMPNWMNNVSSKLESIAQAMFNSAITRQTLPGWHAAQVTQIGHGMKVMDSNGKLRELKYHPEVVDEDGNVKQEAYAEVLIPRWSNMIPKGYDISKIESEGLDIQLAYRIPTEGKQSVSVVKVVGFLDDSYGSTIMLPDEWVTQTGADFDVDSVYAICYEMYETKNKYGETVLKKYTKDTYKTDESKYREYVLDNIEEKLYVDSIEDKLNPNKYKKYKEEVKKLYRNKDYNGISKIAEEIGLLSFDDFKELDETSKLPRKVRTNIMIDAMIGIMSSIESREENYARSNFDDLTDAKNEMDEARGATKVNRSTYNPLDQIDFMENATSGLSLKAFSVNRDTFNSVNNYVKSNLSNADSISVEYDLNEYDIDIIIDAYGLVDDGGVVTLEDANGNITNEKDKAVKAIVKHNRLGNSKNNRNVVGKLITVYSSETTAHILDAIKEGAIFNENKYTFGTFKTLIDLGIDYRTAIAFLMQPAITTINRINNETDSIYVGNTANVNQTAIKELAAKLGVTINGKPVDRYSNYYSVIKAINENKDIQSVLKELFGASYDTTRPILSQSYPMNATMLKKRLENAIITNNSELSQERKEFIDNVFDLAMAINFDKFYNTTQNIEKIMRTTNPDKFGAKQTIRATRNVYNMAREYGFNSKNPTSKVIRVGDKSLIEALYPGLTEENDIKVEESAYPFLAAYFKYSTIPSIDVNKLLFPTENDTFNSIVDGVQRKMGTIFSDEQYKEFKQYVIADLYSGIPIISTCMTVTAEGRFDVNKRLIDEINSTEEDKTFDVPFWDYEITRVYGYREDIDGNVKINDFNNPTEDDIHTWTKLTPAQKVMYIQTRLNGYKGIFDYLNINSFNQYEYKTKGYSQQTIRFTDGIYNNEELYNAFRDTFYNSNPLIRLAALDLIKYAFIVEGFKFKKGGISKIIPNDVLYKDVNDLGTGIIETARKMFQETFNIREQMLTRNIDRFVRSHVDYVKQLKLNVPQRTGSNRNIAEQFKEIVGGNGILFIPYNGNYDSLINAIYERNSNFNLETEQRFRDYVVIDRWISKEKRTKTLYKIKNVGNGICLIPMNPLERNETYDNSVNNNNNLFPPLEYLESIIEANLYVNGEQLQVNNIGEVTAINDEYRKHILPKFKFTKRNIGDNYRTLTNILETSNDDIERSTIRTFIEKINKSLVNDFTNTQDYVLVYHNEPRVSRLFELNQKVYQEITDSNGNPIFIEIQRISGTNTYINNINKGKKVKSTYYEKMLNIEKEYHPNGDNIMLVKNNIYKIQTLTSEESKEQTEEQVKSDEKAIAPDMNAITPDVEDVDIENIDRIDILDDITKDIINSVKRAQKQGDKYAAEALRSLEVNGINDYRLADLSNNRKTIYSILARYIELHSSILEKHLNEYEIDGVKYNLGSDELYDALLKHPEHAEDIVKLLLEAITFGDQFADILTLPFTGVDEEVTNSISRIRNAILKIRNNSIVKQGFDKMFNKYIANKYSTNPNIRLGITKLSDTFGDSGWWETWIGDIHSLSNKEVQAVVKLVDLIMTEAVMDAAPKKKKEFTDRFDEIEDMAGTITWSKLIDADGKLIRPYHSSFIDDREKLKAEVQYAKDNYGIDSMEYIEAKLKRDEWMAKNVHQIVVQDYYLEKNALTRRAIEVAPNEYLQYMKYIHEIYADRRSYNTLTKEEKDRRREVNKKIRELLSTVREDGSEKSLEEIRRISVLKECIEKKRELEEKYFDFRESEAFKEALKTNLDIVTKYEKDNPEQTLDVRLQNERYREAYEWIKSNTYYIVDKETNKAINEAFAKLGDKNNPKNKQIRTIIEQANAYDEFGNIDARKLSNEDIAKIKEICKYKYDKDAGERILIKETGEIEAFTSEFYKLIQNPNERTGEAVKRKMEITAKINELISKFINDAGEIRAKEMFDKLTEEEIDELAQLYYELRGIKSGRSKEDLNKLKEIVSFKTNQEAFNREMIWAKENLRSNANGFENTKKARQFIAIFTALDKDGAPILDENGNYIPNSMLFGYIVPKDEKYIDKGKLEARKLIEENVEFVPTEYYYAAKKQAEKEGRFKEWYEANHVYNPYTRKWEPLKIWTVMHINPNGSLKGTYSYVPTNENVEKSVKDEYINKEYKQGTTNYNTRTGDYNNNISLNEKENAMQEHLEAAMQFLEENNPNNVFIKQGYIPRRRKVVTDTKWAIGQALGTIGFEYRNTSDEKWSEKIDYAHDKEPENRLLQQLRGKGTQKLEEVRPKGIDESDAEYQEYLKAVNERNEKIRENNRKIDNELRDDNYRDAFADAIGVDVINKYRNRAKNWLYLLQEELKHNEAFAISPFTGKMKKDKKRSTDNRTKFATTSNHNTLLQVETYIRRLIFEEFRVKTKLNSFADLARNITSAKYMIFNVTGGVANIATGYANILAEAFAGDSISHSSLRKGVLMYIENSLSMLANMYNSNSDNFAVQLTKYFDVVDFDAMIEKTPSATAGEYIRRVRNLLYGLQSGGEHFMQNSVLFAMLHECRIFDDVDGTKRCGTFSQYTWKVDYDVLVDMIKDNPELYNLFKATKQNIRKNKDIAHKYDTFKNDFVEDFVRANFTDEQINEYIARRDEAHAKAKEKWESMPVAIDQFELNDKNEIVIKEGSEMTEEMKYEFKNNVIQLNKKIHGVYDKLGAARIEMFWWGSLVMQYHKHIYPGFMKRFRIKGYYNEQTGTVEIGSYVALVRLLGKGFNGIKSRIEDRTGNGESVIIASIREVGKAILNGIIKIKTNWKLMPKWEQRAVRRCLGDLYGIVSALIMSIGLYALTDDDDEDDELIATMFYISDRLLAEAQMYTPWGMVSEFSTLWSSPIAAVNGPKDLLKCFSMALEWMFDENFNATYTTGLYKGENKFWVMLRRNIPLYRVIHRLQTMPKNNSYYRINEKSLNMGFAKDVADMIVG